jgi:DNA-binding NarL/FixJ family response regulator
MLVEARSPTLGDRIAAPLSRSFLLLEPFSVLRQTVASVARSLGIAQIHQSTTLKSALQQVGLMRFDGLVVAVGDERDEIELIRRLRAGQTESMPSIPVAVMTSECDAGMVLVLRELQVSRILLKPFKVKSILETVSQMVQSSPLPR